MTQDPRSNGPSRMVNAAEKVPASRKQENRSEGMSLQAEKLSLPPARRGAKTTGDRSTTIVNFSIAIPANEIAVLYGPDRAQVTALLEALAGFDPSAARQVKIDEVTLSENPKAFRPYIGFVPAEDGLHGNLTVLEILQYGEVLRMPRGLPEEARRRRLGEMLAVTGLGPLVNRPFGALDAVEKRLVSIAVALINQPRLLFVDLPNIPLGPAGEARITTLLCEQARNGCTVVQAAETARCARLADKVILLAADGTLAWFGPAEEALPWIHSQANQGDGAGASIPVSGANGNAAAFTFDDALSVVRNPPGGKKETWFERYQAQPAYQKYIDDPLNGRLPDLYLQDRPLAHFRGAKNGALPPPPAQRIPAILKLNLLIDRGARLLVRDRTSLVTLAAVPLIALADLLLSTPEMNDPVTGSPERTPVVLGLLVFLAMFLAAMLFRNEIIREREVFRREQRDSPLAFPYILSKLWIVGFFALYQGLVFAAIHFFASGMGGGIRALLSYWMTLALVSLIGGLIGLISSAASRTWQAVPVWVLAMIVPQLFLSGSIVPLPDLTPPARILSWANPSRYAFESLVTASGYGQDLANDSCWQMPEAQRIALSETQKQSCGCLGGNIYSQCNFPGVHKFFTQGAAWQQSPALVIGQAEGVLAQAYDHYGAAFQVNLLQRWLILLGISALLTIPLFWIQKRKAGL